MAATEPKDIPAITIPQENGNVHIRVDNAPTPPKEMSKRSLMAIIGGTIGGIVGYGATKLGLNSQMAEFENAVDQATKATITGRGGLGAAFTETGGFISNGSLGPGMASGEIYRANYGTLARSGKYGKLPKVLFDTFRTEGVSALAVGGAVVAGAAAAAVAYNAAGPDKKQPDSAGKEGEWANKVAASDKDQTRALS